VTQVRWDKDRESRTGVPEVVYGPGKTNAHLRGIFENADDLRMASRLSDDQMEVLSDLATIHQEARMAVRNPRAKRDMPVVPVVTAGTADIPVALEAATTLDAMGVPTSTHFDVGVAGIHRLQSILPELTAARVCIVVAGMDGALPAVIAGLLRARPDGAQRHQGAQDCEAVSRGFAGPEHLNPDMQQRVVERRASVVADHARYLTEGVRRDSDRPGLVEPQLAAELAAAQARRDEHQPEQDHGLRRPGDGRDRARARVVARDHGARDAPQERGRREQQHVPVGGPRARLRGRRQPG